MQAGFGTMWGILIAAAIFGAGVWQLLRQRLVAALLFLLPVPVVLMSTLAMDRPVRPRFVFFAIGFVLLVTVHGAAAIGSWLTRVNPAAVMPRTGATLSVVLVSLGAIVLSVLALPYGYRYPKQDYPGAIGLVEHEKADGDIVVAIGDPVAIPAQGYFGKSWERVDDASELRKLRTEASAVWVVHTFSSSLATRLPELWTMLLKCAVIGEFEGTVDDGTISVRRCQ
jgi:hypothetical protein